MKPAIRKIFWLYTILFFILIVYLFKLALVDSRDYITNSYNPRLSQTAEDVKRGNILDSKGTIIAEDVVSDTGKYTRKYNYPLAFSHLVGYTSKGMSGIESKYNFSLESVDSELWQRIYSLITNEEIEANSVALTIDADLQAYASEQLGNSKGAVIALEPSTGKILTMVSYPNFNPNDINEIWSDINTDEDNSPLLNRATQGVYPPGSVYKIVTAVSALTNQPQLMDFEMKCEGIKTFGNNKIRCFDQKAHGTETMTKAFAKSCNTYFATLGTTLGATKLIDTSNQMLFNSPLNYKLEYSKSSFALSPTATDSEIIETAIGQGKTLVTPMHMALITSAIANNGIMMEPYVVDHIETPTGREKQITVPKMLSQITTPEIAQQIKGLMEEVVISGTATDASFYIDSVTSGSAISASSIDTPKYTGTIKVAGKTGTAETPTGADHAWFVAFAPADNPQIAVAVVLENAGKGSKSIPIARNVMKKYITSLQDN